MPSRKSSSPARERLSAASAALVAQNKALFDQLDTNGSGTLDAMEIQTALIAMNGGSNAAMTGAQVLMMIAEADTDGDGEVDYNEVRCCAVPDIDVAVPHI